MEMILLLFILLLLPHLLDYSALRITMDMAACSRTKLQMLLKVSQRTDSPWRSALSSLPGFLLLLISHHFQIVHAERFKVISPDHPVVAVLGEDAVLPCHLSPALSAEHMEVRWFQTRFDFIVHLYENGMDQNREQLLQYRDRTEFIRNYISSGSVSLRIHNVGLNDEGSYTCFFQSDNYYEDATLELKVAGLGNALSISVNGHQDRGIRVLCESAGWYPEPEVTWSQEDGQNLTSVSETETQVHNGLFSIKTSLLMRTNQYGKISCNIRNTVVNHERESLISIADPFFQQVSRWVTSLFILLVSVIIPCGLLVGLVIYHSWKERQEKEKLSADVEKLSADYGACLEEKKKLSADYGACLEENRKLSAAHDKLSADYVWLKECARYTVDVTLDPETAHRILDLSEDRKSVRLGDELQNDVPDNPKRFDTIYSVLGCEGFTSGRHFWEVQVEDNWRLGVCKDSVRRRCEGEWIHPSPLKGYWVLQWWKGEYSALTSPEKPLSQEMIPRALGIFLDYDAGKVSFYNADNKTKLFTFTETFTEKLWPFFYTNSKNPMRIRKVAACE